MAFELPDELMFIKNSKLPQKSSRESMDGKVCVMTGATSGVGYAGAKRLAKGGAKIVIIARNVDKADKVCREFSELSGKKAQYYLADFADLKQVRTAVEQILKDIPVIDVLINSAGLHITQRTLTSAGHETAFCVNHLASFLITDMLIPRLREHAPARIIQINSEGHRFGGLRLNDLNWKKRLYTGLGSYGASKTAQLLTVWELNDMLKGSSITINAVHPGEVRTNIGSNNGPLYKFWLHNVTWHFLKDADIAGQAIYYHASSPEMNGVSGKFYNLTHPEKPAAHALNRHLSKLVLDKTQKMIHEALI